MHVAYLVNQYPTVSHTFIRREIQALEQLGFSVTRVSVRDTTSSIVDPLDVAEGEKTLVLLSVPKCGLALLRMAATRPLRLLAAVGCVVRMWRNAGYGSPRQLAYLAEACRLAVEARRLGIEHVHAHFGTNSAAVAMLCRLLGGPPFSFTVHGPEEFDRPIVEYLAEKVAAAEFVVVVSFFGRSQLQRWSDRKHWSKIAVVRCGLDGSYLNRRPIPLSNANRLVCVARLSEQKGLFTLIEAALRLAEQIDNFELILVGEGPLRSELQQMIDGSSGRNCVQLVGAQTEEQVQQWLVSSRCFVLPSYAEGLPVVIMEALALARPVIASQISGIPELVVSGENGWLVPAGSVDHLVTAMLRALTTPVDRLYEMGLRGRERVLELHDIAQSAQQLAALLSAEQRSAEKGTGTFCSEDSAK